MKLHSGTFGPLPTTRLLLFILITVALSVSGVLANPVLAQGSTTVILVRHAEKVDDAANRDPDLSDEGRQRAQLLADMLQDAGVTRIYATPFKRTVNTTWPLAVLTGVEVVETPISRTWIQDLADRISSEDAGETVLVVGHSNSTPGVVNALTGSDYAQFEEGDYDNLFVVTLNPDGSSSVVKLRFGM